MWPEWWTGRSGPDILARLEYGGAWGIFIEPNQPNLEMLRGEQTDRHPSHDTWHAYKLAEIASMLTHYQAENGYRFFRAASLSDLLPIGTYRHPSWLTRAPGRQFQLSNTNLGFCIPATIRFQSMGSLPGDDGRVAICSSLSGVKHRPGSLSELHGVEPSWPVI